MAKLFILAILKMIHKSYFLALPLWYRFRSLQAQNYHVVILEIFSTGTIIWLFYKGYHTNFDMLAVAIMHFAITKGLRHNHNSTSVGLTINTLTSISDVNKGIFQLSYVVNHCSHVSFLLFGFLVHLQVRILKMN